MKKYFDCDRIQYEGAGSKNPLAFKHYNPEQLIDGKSMKEHLRFAAPYWHVMRNELADPFGGGTAQMPWDDRSDSTDNALKRVDVFFEFLEVMGTTTIAGTNGTSHQNSTTCPNPIKPWKRSLQNSKKSKRKQAFNLSYGAACLFSHPRYAQGGATSPDLNVYTYAAAQVKKALECTKELDGLGYTFWEGVRAMPPY